MYLAVNCISYKNALQLIEMGVEHIYVGIKNFSNRTYALTFDEISDLANKYNNNIVIVLNKIYFENEIKDLEKLLLDLNKTKVFGIAFSDYAVNQILFENNLLERFYLIYNPDTLVSNYQQFPFYSKNGIKEVSLPREINKNSIKTFGLNKQGMKMQLQVCGYQFMMDSRWNLLSNFKTSYDLKFETTGKKFLKELKRDMPFIINEDESGTHIYTAYNLNLLSKINELKSFNIDTIRIDSYLHSEEWIISMAKIFLEQINSTKQLELINDFNEKQSIGFYDSNPNDMLYLDTNAKIEETKG